MNSGANSTETSVKSSYAVIYTLREKAWQVSGEGGWSELHLCKDQADNTYRLLAWTTEGAEVLLNANITSECNYKSKSMNFHCFTDENGTRYGLGFHKSEEAIGQADTFMNTVKGVITECKRVESMGAPKANIPSGFGQGPGTMMAPPAQNSFTSPTAPPKRSHIPDTASPFAPPPDQRPPATHSGSRQSSFIPGTDLKIGVPKPKKGTVEKRIGVPSRVVHLQHATFAGGQFSGLPQEWSEELNKNFGVPPKMLAQKEKLPGYESPIPRVLVQMNAYLQNNSGYYAVGIFRKAPDSTENSDIKKLLDSGNFDVRGCDVHVMANLIKVWFRDLPTPILDSIDPEVKQRIASAQSTQAAADLLQRFPEPQRSIIMWLLDVCVNIARYEDRNKMTAQNLAIVIGPNLFNVDSYNDPMAAMGFSQKVVAFFQKCIEWRQQVHDQ